MKTELVQYAMLFALPVPMHKPADMALASALISAPMWISDVNPWLAFIGGIVGLFIGVVRVYEILKGFFIKPKL